MGSGASQRPGHSVGRSFAGGAPVYQVLEKRRFFEGAAVFWQLRSGWELEPHSPANAQHSSKTSRTHV